MGELQRRRGIHDGLHGLIPLTDQEMALIDHPLFQRLHRIQQTGLLNLVFPSATHTRFVHSPGVLYMADCLFEALLQRSEASAHKLYPLATAHERQAVRIHELATETRLELHKLIRLAALVHDLGHGPLSHSFDPFAPCVGEIGKLLQTDPRLALLLPCWHHLMGQARSAHIHHEIMSCLFFTVIWQEIGGEPWVPAALVAVLVNKTGTSALVPEALRPWIPLVRDIVSSAPIDADRMDYLLRDSRIMGLSYGLYEPDRILKSALCVAKRADGEQHYRLGWRKSGLSAIETFVTARYRMFKEVYHHKTWRATELMLNEVCRAAERAQLSIIDASSLDSLMAGYLQLGDDVFIQMLAGNLKPGFPNQPEVQRLAQQILDRCLWRRVHDFEPTDTAEYRQQFIGHLQGSFPNAQLILDVKALRAMKGLDEGACLLRMDGQNCYSESTYIDDSWAKASNIMRTMREEELSLARIFMKVDRETVASAKIVRYSALNLSSRRYDLAEQATERAGG